MQGVIADGIEKAGGQDEVIANPRLVELHREQHTLMEGKEPVMPFVDNGASIG